MQAGHHPESEVAGEGEIDHHHIGLGHESVESTQIYEGTNQIQRVVIAKRLLQ